MTSSKTFSSCPVSEGSVTIEAGGKQNLAQKGIALTVGTDATEHALMTSPCCLLLSAVGSPEKAWQGKYFCPRSFVRILLPSLMTCFSCTR